MTAELDRAMERLMTEVEQEEAERQEHDVDDAERAVQSGVGSFVVEVP